ncbi:MAG: polyprenol monophosphomannose synthase [Candidatus Bathyarchaeia archaeon]
MGRIGIIIPTYNEAENLPELVSEIEKKMVGHDFVLIIIDDNSEDGTWRVAEDLKRFYGNIMVKKRAEKLGIGSAVLDGIRTALADERVDLIVTLDGDLSHCPKDIPRLVNAAFEADVIQGSRYVKDGRINGWSLTRRLASLLANLFCRLLFGNSPYDYTGNFKVYSRRCATLIAKYTGCRGFEWVVEAMVTAKRHGFKIKEVPITFNGRKNGSTKLRAKEVRAWMFFAFKALLQGFGYWNSGSSLGFKVYSNRVIQKSSTFNETLAEPVVSTTM